MAAARWPRVAAQAATGRQALVISAERPKLRGRSASRAYVLPASARTRSARCQPRRAPPGLPRTCSPWHAGARSLRHTPQPFGRRARVDVWVSVARWPRCRDTTNLGAYGSTGRDDFRLQIIGSSSAFRPPWRRDPSADRRLADASAACPVGSASPLRRTPAGSGLPFR